VAEEALHINPYTLPADKHGWRGLTIPGNHKRKWYTVLQNDKLLVTALLLMPGEASIRHSHESGELSVHFADAIRPEVTWNPPGVVHGGPAAPGPSLFEAVAENLKLQKEKLTSTGKGDIAEIVEQIMALQGQMQELEKSLRDQLRPAPSPRVIVDILFPPFRTTIDDPAAESKTVTGQWFD